MADASTLHSQEASGPAETTSKRGRSETERRLKPTLVKPEVQPKKEVVDFYNVE